MRFSVVDTLPFGFDIHGDHAFLVNDNWDDFSFRTLYNLWVKEEGDDPCEIGLVKIGFLGMRDNAERPPLPVKFDALSNNFFSLGQDDKYYVNLQKLAPEKQRTVLTCLNDVAYNKDLYETAQDEPVFKTSLMRYVTERSVKNQFTRIINGGSQLVSYDFSYHGPVNESIPGTSLNLEFHVEPYSIPPTNVHALIGRNGAGKTLLLNNMIGSLRHIITETDDYGTFDMNNSLGEFVNLVKVSFSAFDEDFLDLQGVMNPLLQYNSIGLLRASSNSPPMKKPKTVDMLTEEFCISIGVCRKMYKDCWKKAIATLESDPLLSESEVASIVDADDDTYALLADSIFRNLSSGHKAVLLTITRLVEQVAEQSFVILDEPENYLHPPLLASFIRALSDLLVERNGVAIIATHSPVVLQEIPTKCVYRLNRCGDVQTATRPRIETFGENIGIITSDVFDLEVERSGFHNLLAEMVREGKSYNHILADFDDSLGLEARAILRSMVHRHRNES